MLVAFPTPPPPIIVVVYTVLYRNIITKLDEGPRVGWGGGGVLRISSDGDDQIGAKIKTQKNLMPNFRALKTKYLTVQYFVLY